MNRAEHPRPLKTALLRGVRGRCPHCGEGKLFHRYLRVVDRCDLCHEEYFHQRADDAPPYVTIVLVGHIVVPLLLHVEMTWAPPLLVQFAIWPPLTLVLSLLLLQPVKGLLVALQWALRMHGFGADGPGEPTPVLAERPGKAG